MLTGFEFWIHYTDRREIVFDRDERVISDGAPGRLVAANLRSLQERSDADEGDSVLNPAEMLVRRQLRRWLAEGPRPGRISWNPHYSEVDPDDGPTNMLASRLGRQLLQEIGWRGAAAGAVEARQAMEVFHLGSVAAALLLSAHHGAMRGNLKACLNCRQLFCVGGRGAAKRKRCSACQPPRVQGGSVPSTLQREYRRLQERLRKRTARGTVAVRKQCAEIGGQCYRIREQAIDGTLTTAEALAKLRELVPDRRCVSKTRSPIPNQRLN